MKIKIDYGKSGLEVDLPDNLNLDVIEPKYVPALPDQAGEVRRALHNPIASRPLHELIKPTDTVGIVVNDITRATPYNIILPVLLGELSHIDDEHIILLVATGTHRPNTTDELNTMLGKSIVSKYRIVQNDANDRDSHVLVGTTRSGSDIKIHRQYLNCDLRILTGFIEPHFFAGFSGGPKACMPGMALMETILRNHCPANIDHPKATWGVTQTNPIWEEISEAARLAGQSFLLNVAMNRDRKITAVFAGDTETAHKLGCDFVRDTAMVTVNKSYDIVITSNAGHPLDLNLYQAVKGISAAAQIVKEGGSIIIAADCWDGIPEHGQFKKLLFEADNPASLLEQIRAGSFYCQDVWQAQIHARNCEKADVYLYSDNLTDEQIEGAMLKPCRNIPETLGKLLQIHGADASICVLPQGPETIPYICG